MSIYQILQRKSNINQLQLILHNNKKRKSIIKIFKSIIKKTATTMTWPPTITSTSRQH